MECAGRHISRMRRTGGGGGGIVRAGCGGIPEWPAARAAPTGARVAPLPASHFGMCAGLFVLPASHLSLPEGIKALWTGLLFRPYTNICMPAGMKFLPTGRILLRAGLLLLCAGIKDLRASLLFLPPGRKVLPEAFLAKKEYRFVYVAGVRRRAGGRGTGPEHGTSWNAGSPAVRVARETGSCNGMAGNGPRGTLGAGRRRVARERAPTVPSTSAG
jgi:hypothetical protein